MTASTIRNGIEHLYKLGDGKFAIFNSLTLKIAYGNEHLRRAFDAHKDNKTSTCGTAEMSVLAELVKNRVIISRTDQDNLINELKHSIETSEIATLYLLPTLDCDTSCSYCIVRDIARERWDCRKSMEHEEIFHALKTFYILSSNSKRRRDIVIFGGEPSMVPDIVNQIGRTVRDDFDDHESNLVVVSNGIGIHRIIQSIRRYDIFPIISIDGYAGRGNMSRGNYEIESCFKALRESGMHFGLSITLGKHNIIGFEKEILSIVDQFKPLEIGINNYLHSRLDCYPNEFYLAGEDISELLFRLYIHLAERGIFFEQLLRRMRPFIEETPRLKECPACGGKIVFLPDRTMGRCEYFSLNRLHLLEYSNPFSSIAMTNNEWAKLSPINWGYCKDCECRMLCGGGCIYDNYSATNSVETRDRLRCDQDRMTLRLMILALYNLLNRPDDDVFFPTVEEKRKLYFNAKDDEFVPLQSSSRAGEFNFRSAK